MNKTALQEAHIDTWIKVNPVRPGEGIPNGMRLEADRLYIDHGGKLRIKIKNNRDYSDFDDAMSEGHSPLVRYEVELGGQKYQGEGNAVLYQDEIILKDLGKSEQNKIMKTVTSSLAREIKALEQKVAKPDQDGRTEAIADFLENGLEHGSDEDGIYHLQHEFGLRHEVAQKLVKEWNKFNISRVNGPLHNYQNSVVLPFIEKIIKIGAVNVKVSDVLDEYKKLGADDAAIQKLAEKYKVDLKALSKALASL